MDTPAPAKPPRINRWLPYWAVFQADLRQTLCSWVYRVWIIMSLLAAIGYLLYYGGVSKEAGIVQSSARLISDLLRWSVLGSVTLIIVLAGGCISGERGIMADSVLSRGISRYQYFLGKWHARLVTVIGTFLLMGLMALAGSFFFFHEDLSIPGSLVALAMVVGLLAVVTSCCVSVSAVANSTMVGIAVLWIVMYGVGFLLSRLPEHVVTPDRLLNNLPNTLRGFYDLHLLVRLLGWSALASFVVGIVGMGYFARRDV